MPDSTCGRVAKALAVVLALMGAVSILWRLAT